MLLSLIAMLAQGYDIQVVLEKEYHPNSRRSARVTVLTDANLVAGYLAFAPDHGRLPEPEAFICERGKVEWLPLGRFEHGQVMSGNDRVLVGSVWLGRNSRAAKWTRDPHTGWSAAKLETLSELESTAWAIDEDGNTFITESTRGESDAELLKRLGPAGPRSWSVSNFIPLRIGRDGTVWGYTYDKSSFGGFPDALAKLSDSGVDVVRADFDLTDVNTLGDCCGAARPSRDSVHAYVNGARVVVPIESGIDVRSLNVHGDLVGTHWDRETKKSFLYSKGKVSYLPPPTPKAGALEPAKINSKGTIVGTVRNEGRIGVYVYTPRN